MPATACVACCIATGATPGSGLPSCVIAARSPTTNTSRMAGDRQIGLDDHAPDAIDRHAERAPERRGGDAGGPQHRARFDPLVADVDRPVFDAA